MSLSARTNIWQIGMLMLCAMRMHSPIQEYDLRQHGNDLLANQHLNFAIPAQRMPKRLQHRRAKYSQELRDLVQQCLQFNPPARPTAANLLQAVQRDMAPNIKGRDTYVPRNGKAPLRDRIRDPFDLDDEVALGKQFPPLGVGYDGIGLVEEEEYESWSPIG